MWTTWLRLSAVLFLAIPVGCASQRQEVRPEPAAPAAAPAGGWVVKLEMPDGRVMVHVPPGESEVVELSDAEYEEAIRRAAREISELARTLTGPAACPDLCAGEVERAA